MLETYDRYVEQRLFNREWLAFRRATKHLIKQIDDIKQDIIHLYNIHDHYINYTLLFRYLTSVNIPVVWTQHGSWTFTSSCKCFDMFHCE